MAHLWIMPWLTYGSYRARRYRARIGRVLAYSRVARLSPALRSKLLFYYEVCYPSGAAFDERGFLDEVSRPLRRELCLHKCVPGPRSSAL